MNPTLLLALLLLAVPLQLFFNHYLEQSYSVGSVSEGGAGKSLDGLGGARINAMERLSASMVNLKDQFGATFRYYSSWKNLREFFVIPHKRQVKKSKAIQISAFKTESGNKIKIISTSSKTPSNTKAKSPPLPSTSSQSNGKSAQTETKSTSSGLKSEMLAPTSRAKEVDEYMMKEVYFAQSKEPRTKRSPDVQFYVGQVVKHKMDSYHGVIIGWDPVAKAPDWWIDRFYSKDRKYLIHTPHYHILIDSHFDASGTPYHYIPAKDLEIVSVRTQVSAPEVSKFFEDFEEGKYIPRPWLRERYPLG